MPKPPAEILVRLPTPTPADHENNRNAVFAALEAKGQARMRINIDVYAPGTPDRPKARYYALCGTAPTVHCRTIEAVQHFLESVRRLMDDLDGWRPEAQ